MKIVVLDGYTLNPGDLSWKGLQALGSCDIYDRSTLPEVLKRAVGAEIVLGVLVALLLNREFAGRSLVRALLVLPWALPTIVNAMMWRLIYNPEFGSLNALLSQLSLIGSYRSWLGSPARP